MDRRWLGVMGALLLIGLGVAGWMAWKKPEIPNYLARMGGDFHVQTLQGELQLSDLKGKVVLLYFGYSHCPDVCPATLNLMAAAMRLLDDSKAVQGLFVSVDPNRDTPATLKAYTDFFSPNIIGATSDKANLDAIAAQWRFDYHVPEQPKDDFYTVEHAKFLYVVNRDGKLVALFDEKSDAQRIADAVRMWL